MRRIVAIVLLALATSSTAQVRAPIPEGQALCKDGYCVMSEATARTLIEQAQLIEMVARECGLIE